MTFQAYIDNIKATTGKSPAAFKQLASDKGWIESGKLRAGVKASEVIAWLSAEHALGHGHAMAIVATLKGVKGEHESQPIAAWAQASTTAGGGLATFHPPEPA